MVPASDQVALCRGAVVARKYLLLRPLAAGLTLELSPFGAALGGSF